MPGPQGSSFAPRTAAATLAAGAFTLAAGAFALAAGALALPSLPAAAQQPAYPIEARLTASLDARALAVGDELLLTSTHAWQDGGCRLAQGAALHGKVVAIDSGPHVKRESVALRFLYPCPEQGTFPIHWIALLAPEIDQMKGVDDNPGNVRALRSEAFGEGVGAKSTSSQGVEDPSGRGSPTVPLFADDGRIDPIVKRPVQVHTGDVWQIPRVKLRVASGPGESTIAASTSGRLRLPAGSIFVLSPGQATVLASSPAASLPAAPLPAAPPLTHQQAIAQAVERAMPRLAACAQPACTAHPAAAATPPLSWKLALAPAGFQGFGSAQMTALSYGAALAFLGPDQLLVVFDSRRLVPRSPLDRAEDRAHTMRAVLFQVPSGKILKTLDWRVGDSRQVLWPLGDGRVVLHQGDTLRWFGPGLVAQQQLPLSGTLAFFRASPDALHYAVGTFRELHTPAEHQRLVDSDAAGPEERIAVQVLDAGLHPIDGGEQSSRAYPPILLNRGRVELRNFKGREFYLRERAWQDSTTRSFARVSSACIPRVAGLASDMVTLETCPGGMERHVDVLREDGSPVLATAARLEDFAPLANGGHAGLFALALLHGTAVAAGNSPFRPQDLAGETVHVFRCGDGHMLSSIELEYPPPTHQPLALAPDGRSIAVLDGMQIRGYRMSSAPAANPLSAAQPAAPPAPAAQPAAAVPAPALTATH